MFSSSIPKTILVLILNCHVAARVAERGSEIGTGRQESSQGQIN